MTSRRPRRLTWAEVSGRRLARQGLLEPLDGARPADAVAAMCGTHAQLLSAAEVSVALRLAGATRSDVRAALWTERTVVKTFGPRGTVHLLPARDLPMWCAALSELPRPPSPFADDVRMTEQQTEAVLSAIADALAGDTALTIDELTDAVVARTGPWAGDLVMPAFQVRWPRWRQVLALAGARGLLCYGPDRGRVATYTRPPRPAPGSVPAGPAAVEALLRQYLSAYGPATPQHLARWLNTTPAWATALFASVEGDLEPVELDGTPGWQLAGEPATAAASGVRLLPYFDAYVVAGQPRALLFPGRAAERALAGGQAGNFPVLLVDGTVAGVWHAKRAGRKVAITVEPLGRLTRDRQRSLDRAVSRVGEILEADATLTVGPVSVGAHA